MTSLLRDARGFWVGLGALLAVGVFLGVRSGEAVTAVLGAKRSVPGAAPARTPRTADRLLGRRDSLLACAVPGDRDPFRAPETHTTGPAQMRSTAATPPEVPTLRALLFDNVNPSVQLSIGGTTSGWLHQGDEYQGWTVARIRPDSVQVTRGVTSVVLPAS